MKQPRILLIVLLLAAAVTGCKDKHSKPESPDNVSAKKHANTTASFQDRIEIDSSNDIIFVTAYLRVASENFEVVGKPIIINRGQFKGIAYRYQDITNHTTDNGDSVIMPVTFAIRNDDPEHKWARGNKIRLMAFNENSEEEFISLKPYFSDRVAAFQLRDVDINGLRDFNQRWNQEHDGLDVSTYGDKIDQKDILSPRLTKKDILLSITRR